MIDIATIESLCIVSAVLSVVICLYARVLGRATNLLDRPDGILKLHGTETPLVGGIAFLAPSLLVSFIFFLRFATAPFMLVGLIAAACTLIIGVIDDYIGLSPFRRLVGLSVLVLVVFFVEPLFTLHALRFGVTGFDAGIPLGIFAVPITALMIIGLLNATNMADGMNGQMLGSILIWCLFLTRYLGFEVGMPFLAIFCSGIVTFSFNMRGRLFSGSAGAYAASLFIGLGTIAAYRQSGAMSAVEPILWFWLPVLDCLRLMVTRALARKSPFAGDRNHIHHVLQDYMSASAALVVYLGLLAAPGLVAVMTNDRLAGTVILIIGIGCYGAFIYARPRVSLTASRPSVTPTLARSNFVAENFTRRPKEEVTR